MVELEPPKLQTHLPQISKPDIGIEISKDRNWPNSAIRDPALAEFLRIRE